MESSTTFTIPSSPSPERRYEASQSINRNQDLLPDLESANGEADASNPDKMELSSELTFKKKDVRKSRTQSFQSVLSTASLKSLKQQYANSHTTSTATASRQNSVAGNLNHSHSKNFQSYIQAPVFSSISSYKRDDEVEIGQRMPFHDEKDKSPQSLTKMEETHSNPEDNQEDQDTVIQQHKLTLNALKKLSLSPMLSSHPKEGQINNVSFKESQLVANTEPYQPAEVDLSRFASLTRQPKLSQLSQSSLGRGPSPKETAATESPTTVEAPPDEKRESEENSTTTNTSVPIPVAPNRTELPNLAAVNNRVPSNASSNATISLPSSLMNPRNVPPVQWAMKSPTNEAPQKSKHLQQIKGLRSPMYIPAVLRLTQNENGEPIRRERKGDGPENRHGHSFDSSLDQGKLASSQASVKSVESSALVESTSLLVSPYRNISQRKYNHILLLAPTRKHWVKDEAVLKCGISDCPKSFNFFERRHHCRRCGGIYCKEHTMHYLYINHLAQFTTGGRGTLSKVCDNCIEEYNDFVKHEFGVDVRQYHHSTPNTSATSPINSKPAAASQFSNKNGYSETSNNEQVAGSVPANWSWSSF